MTTHVMRNVGSYESVRIGQEKEIKLMIENFIKITQRSDNSCSRWTNAVKNSGAFLWSMREEKLKEIKSFFIEVKVTLKLLLGSIFSKIISSI